MTVLELMEKLQEAVEMNPEIENAEIRFASQPSWPFAYSIGDNITVISEPIVDEDDYDDSEPFEPAVYLTESVNLGYLPGDVKNAIGW